MMQGIIRPFLLHMDFPALGDGHNNLFQFSNQRQECSGSQQRFNTVKLPDQIWTQDFSRSFSFLDLAALILTTVSHLFRHSFVSYWPRSLTHSTNNLFISMIIVVMFTLNKMRRKSRKECVRGVIPSGDTFLTVRSYSLLGGSGR